MATQTELTLTQNAQNTSNGWNIFNNVGDNLPPQKLTLPENPFFPVGQNDQIVTKNPFFPVGQNDQIVTRNTLFPVGQNNQIPQIKINLPDPQTGKELGEGFPFSPPKIIQGTPGADYINGDQGNDILSGNSGNDILLGNSGDDILQGQKGRDTLNGDDGNDWLDGGRGQDILTGGGGNDTFVLIGSLSAPGPDFADVIMDFQPGNDKILLSDVGGISNVNITQGIGIYANDTILNMANTGQVLAVLKGVTSTTLNNTSDLIFA
jgi:Ca2+-binding RTX toxin-like protein